LHSGLGAGLLQVARRVVKNSVAACCSGDGPVAVSITRSTPANASRRPSPVIRSTPLERENGTTV
jgi:hypothetical protein